MLRNDPVREWIWDGLDEKTGRRVIRGGWWNDCRAVSCTVADRFYFDPKNPHNYSGFRVALSSVS